MFMVCDGINNVLYNVRILTDVLNTGIVCVRGTDRCIDLISI